MQSQIEISVLESGIPPGIHRPELEAAESMLDFLVRHYAGQWANFAERMKEVLNLSESESKRLAARDPAMLSRSSVQEQVTQFANSRLPCHWRTLKYLADLRSRQENVLMGPVVAQVLVLREQNPNGDQSVEHLMTQMGAEIIGVKCGSGRELDFRLVLDKVRCRYLWIVPGGSRFMPTMVRMQLGNILAQFERNAKVALYFDRAYSYVYRVSALRLAADRVSGPLTQEAIHRVLEQMDMLNFQGSDPEHPLCELERIYGGTYPFPKPPHKGIFARLCDR
jgi:hypothetical protein